LVDRPVGPNALAVLLPDGWLGAGPLRAVAVEVPAVGSRGAGEGNVPARRRPPLFLGESVPFGLVLVDQQHELHLRTLCSDTLRRTTRRGLDEETSNRRECGRRERSRERTTMQFVMLTYATEQGAEAYDRATPDEVAADIKRHEEWFAANADSI